MSATSRVQSTTEEELPSSDGGETAPQPRGGLSGNKWVDRILSFAFGAGLLVFGEVAAKNEWVSRFILPAPSDVFRSLVDGIQSGVYVEHLMSTLTATLAGFGISSFVAVLVAAFLVSVPILERVLFPYIVAFQSTPKIAVAPLIIIWLGFGAESKVAIVIIVVFFPVLVNSLAGLKIRERELLDLMRALGASRSQLFWYMRLPHSVPYVFAGLRIGIIFALIGAIVAEFVGSAAGLGYLLLQQRASFNVPGVFAILLILMIVGMTLNGVATRLERRVAFWSQDITTTAP